MERILSRPFDLVIVDVNMPRMDGFTFLRSLRRGPSHVASLPALIVSTESKWGILRKHVQLVLISIW